MSALLLLPAAILLDLLLGDPNTPLHPVRLIGQLAAVVERLLRRSQGSRFLGFFAWFIVVAAAVSVVSVLINLSQRVHPWLAFAVSAVAVYTAIAPRDLATHARRVLLALEAQQLPEARRSVSAIVGRDTEDLDEQEVSRAAVEAVAESTVDGITAPLFWACLLGPLGAIGYRAINTLDSLWGHKDEKYLHFGMFAARADDVANYLPARLTLLWIAFAAWVLRHNASAAWAIGLRDGKLHASPNSGLSEAAFAGALNVTLGGDNRYEGEWHKGPRFGAVNRSPQTATLRQSLALMWATTLLSIITLSVARWFLGKIIPL